MLWEWRENAVRMLWECCENAVRMLWDRYKTNYCGCIRECAAWRYAILRMGRFQCFLQIPICLLTMSLHSPPPYWAAAPHGLSGSSPAPRVLPCTTAGGSGWEMIYWWEEQGWETVYWREEQGWETTQWWGKQGREQRWETTGAGAGAGVRLREETVQCLVGGPGLSKSEDDTVVGEARLRGNLWIKEKG